MPLPGVGRRTPPAAGILRLLPVRPAEHLGERVVWREKELEAERSGELRWLEDPAATVQDALVRVLFEGHGLRRAVRGLTPVLEVHLEAFEGDRTVEPPAALVEGEPPR